MKKPLKILLGALAALATLWLLTYAVQESNCAALREEPYNKATPTLQGLTRLRPVKEERTLFLEGIPGAIFAYYADEKGLELPKGWQPPGTYELNEVHRERGSTTVGTFRFDEPPYNENHVRIMAVTAPELRRVTFKAYFLGVFPVKRVREGYGLFYIEGMGAMIKAYHTGSYAAEHVPVMWQNDLADVQANYISTRDVEALAKAIITGEGFEPLIYPLYADTPGDDVLRYPTKIFFP